MKSRILIWLGIAGMSLGLRAQSFDATAGGSQMYGSSGLVTEYHWGDAYGWTGIGYLNGFQYGAFSSVPLKRLIPGARGRLEMGDQPLSGNLETDEFPSHGFTARGVSLTEGSKSGRLQLFGGDLSEETLQPYLHFANTSSDYFSQTAAEAVIYRQKFSKALEMRSLNLYDGKVTSIQSLGWKPTTGWFVAGAGGVGSGAGYLSGVAQYGRPWMKIRTSYTKAGRDFHRQEGPFSSNETLGLNAHGHISLTDALTIGAAHERMLSYTPLAIGEGGTGSPFIVSTFDSAHVVANLAGIRVSASVSEGEAEGSKGKTTTELITAARRMTRRWRAFGSAIQMRMPGNTDRTYIGINEFRVSPRLALRQNYTWMDGQSTISAGGEWRSNLLSFSVDEQTYISPLAASIGQPGMFQAWTFSVRLRTPHGTTANVDSFIDPTGKMEWGGYLSGLRYDAVTPYRSTGPSFPKYVVHGVVLDQSGKGVWGIALLIGKDVVISDQSGGFFLHVKSSRRLPLVIDKESSLRPGRWEVESAPAAVQGSPESRPGPSLRLVVHIDGEKGG